MALSELIFHFEILCNEYLPFIPTVGAGEPSVHATASQLRSNWQTRPKCDAQPMGDIQQWE